MKIIITGASGLIGRALTENLAKDSHQVIVLSRNPQKINKGSHNINIETWDGQTAQEWVCLVDGADAIINISGENQSVERWKGWTRHEIIENQVHAGGALVQAIRQVKNKPKVLVQSSAIGYYAPGGDALLSEDAPKGYDFLAYICQVGEASTQPVENLGVRRVVIRPGVILDYNSGALSRMLLPYKFFLGGPVGSGDQWLSWVHVQDAVRAIRFLFEQPEAQGVFNIAAHPVTSRQFAQIIGKILWRPALFNLPSVFTHLTLGEMSKVVLEGKRVSAKRLINLGFRFKFPQAEEALKDLLKRPKITEFEDQQERSPNHKRDQTCDRTT